MKQRPLPCRGTIPGAARCLTRLRRQPELCSLRWAALATARSRGILEISSDRGDVRSGLTPSRPVSHLAPPSPLFLLLQQAPERAAQPPEPQRPPGGRDVSLLCRGTRSRDAPSKCGDFGKRGGRGAQACGGRRCRGARGGRVGAHCSVSLRQRLSVARVTVWKSNHGAQPRQGSRRVLSWPPLAPFAQGCYQLGSQI